MNSSSGKSYTEKIMRYACNTTAKDIPENVLEQAKIIILDSIGALLAASSPKYSGSKIITEFVRRLGGTKEATVVGREFKTASVNAALANGTLGYYCDIEPHHPGAILHPTAVLLPSSLAVAEREDASGLDVITSFVLGVDIETRLSYALSPREQYSRGFHPSSVCGSLAASITAAKVMGLNERQMLNALGLAGCQASGLLAWENDRTEMSRPFQMGVAARNGVTSALLASDGFAGPEVIEGKYNIFNAFSGTSNYEEIPKDLGKTFQIMELAFKRYSCCAFLHPGLDALLDLIRNNDIKPEEIRQIILRFPKSGAKLIDNSELRSHNAQYILSVAAFKKKVRIDDILVYEQNTPQIEELSKRIQVYYDDDLDHYFPERYTSVVVLKTTRGETFEGQVEFAKGTPENPLSNEEVETKFRSLTSIVIDEKRQRKIIQIVKNLDRCQKITDLTSLLSFHQAYTTLSES
jgi:2-methylcitrate dehydratase PrpD